MTDPHSKIRAEIRDLLLSEGYTPSSVDEVVDLAIHASQAALDAVRDVAFRASSNVQKAAIIPIAMSLAIDGFENARAHFLAEMASRQIESKSTRLGAVND